MLPPLFHCGDAEKVPHTSDGAPGERPRKWEGGCSRASSAKRWIPLPFSASETFVTWKVRGLGQISQPVGNNGLVLTRI
jgi:hypothetical protein